MCSHDAKQLIDVTTFVLVCVLACVFIQSWVYDYQKFKTVNDITIVIHVHKCVNAVIYVYKLSKT